MQGPCRKNQEMIKQTLRSIGQHKKEVAPEEWPKLFTCIGWADKGKVHAVRRLKVSGMVKTMVEAAKEDNGFEAW